MEPVLIPVTVETTVEAAFSSPFNKQLIRTYVGVSSGPIRYTASVGESIDFVLNGVLCGSELGTLTSSNMFFSGQSAQVLTFSVFAPSERSELFRARMEH